MTMISFHGGNGTKLPLRSPSWLSRLAALGHQLNTARLRRQNRRILENLPADTLKDIGWPTNDTKRMTIVRR